MWLPCAGGRCTVHCKATCATPAFKRDKTSASCPSLLSTLFCLTNLHLEHFFWAEKIRGSQDKMFDSCRRFKDEQRGDISSRTWKIKSVEWFLGKTKTNLILFKCTAPTRDKKYSPGRFVTTRTNQPAQPLNWGKHLRRKICGQQRNQKNKGRKKLEKTKFGQNTDKG